MTETKQPECRKVTYIPKRGRKGVTSITTYVPVGYDIPNVGTIIEDIPLYDRTSVINECVKTLDKILFGNMDADAVFAALEDLKEK